MTILCEHGCGQLSTVFLKPSRKIKNGRWQCAKSHLSCPAIKEKRYKTNIKKIGVKNPFILYNMTVDNTQKKKNNEKRKQTMQKNYGVDGNFGRKEVLERGKETMIIKHGTSQPMHVSEFVQKVMITNLEKIGVPTNLLLLQSQYQKSKIASKWLDDMNIENREVIIKIKDGKYFKVDGLSSDGKTIYEFYGDYWHGNLQKYQEDFYNTKAHATMKELYLRTKERENILKENGYELITIWESDYKK